MSANEVEGVDHSPDADEAWQVFVWLRHRGGVAARTVRSSGPLAAERATTADDQVLATLGTHLIGPWPATPGGASR
ncbi:MAG TPA: hypothetical protein VNN79_13755, partial [Actinomycetota bacterium]|nr:hypothetical protein [Actinomycetota bacterium]